MYRFVMKKNRCNSYDLDILNNKGKLLVAKRNYYDALKCYYKALNIEPKNSIIITNKDYALQRIIKDLNNNE